LFHLHLEESKFNQNSQSNILLILKIIIKISQMKTKLLISLAFSLISLFCNAQNPEKLTGMDWLMGQWQGEGKGEPGKGGGFFSFTYDLDRNIVVRKSHSEYNANNKNSVIRHDDLMIIYSESGDTKLRAIYFDNEGHIINYSVSQADKSVILLSEKKSDAPRFRLTYTPLDDSAVNVKFEISTDGVNFNTYIEGISKKVI